MTDPAEILNWRRLGAGVTTSGQPSEDQLTAIAGLGVSRVINLALHGHEQALPDEAGSVAALGMDYVHIPVAFDDPREQDYVRFVTAIEGAGDSAIHVHCIVNARVSAFFYRYRRALLGEAAARRELESVWRPGGVWAEFIGDPGSAALPHRFAGRDYRA